MIIRTSVGRVIAGLVLLAAAADAQLADLQPGRNFPFAAPAFGNGRSEDVAMGDVDNDGDDDMVLTTFVNSIRVYIQDEGSFSGITLNSIPGSVEKVVLMDINDDGFPDLFAANPDANQVDIELGNGEGFFAPYLTVPASEPEGITLADIDQDGLMDVITVGTDGADLIRQDEPGVFRHRGSYDLPSMRAAVFMEATGRLVGRGGGGVTLVDVH